MEMYEMSHILKCGQRYESGNYKYPGIETGGLFKFRTRIHCGKAQVQEVGDHAAEDQIQIRTSSWWINHPGSVHTKCYGHD